MAKDSYNIDDILSEVKQRKIDNDTKTAKKDDMVEPKSKPKNEQKKDIKIENTNKKSTEIKQEKAKNKDKKIDIIENNNNNKKAETTKNTADNSNKSTNVSVNSTNDSNNKENVADISDEEALKDVTKYAKKYTLGDLNCAEYEEVDQESLGKTKKSKVLKILIIVLSVLVVIGICFGIYFNTMLNKITTDDENPQYGIELNETIHEFPTIEETDASKISSFKDMVKQWYYNGEPAKSSDVINVMLIGEDVNVGNRGNGEIVESGVRADSVIIVSVNRKTQQISLTSVLRDTYAYYETKPGDKKTGEFGKINGAMSSGDVHAYINAVERLYKINIDNYVIVNFESFKSIIDALGGVTMDITETEINHVNNHPEYYGGVKIKKKFEGSKGRQKLNGIEALTYCRIRHLDSDNMRANRQKACLIEIFNELKDSNKVQLVNVITKLLPYVKTGFSKNEILDLVGVALPEGWLQYEIRLNTVPNYRINEKGAGGSFYGAWCWKSDFPQDAYDLQMYIYGKTNIKLAKTRVDVINCKEEGFFEKGSPTVKAVIENEHYGEVSTFERPTYVATYKPEVNVTEKPNNDKTTTTNKVEEKTKENKKPSADKKPEANKESTKPQKPTEVQTTTQAQKTTESQKPTEAQKPTESQKPTEAPKPEVEQNDNKPVE